MRISFLLLFLLCFSLGVVQSQTSCQRSFELLKTPVSTAVEDLTIGSVLFLSDSYLSKLRAGTYDAEESGLRHFAYIRPATRSELKEGLDKLASETEMLGPDGNVYRQVETRSGTHFFRTRKGFHGEYEPTWRDPNLIVPPGLVPVDARSKDGVPLQVIEVTASFLRLRVEEEEWVFFTGYPEISDLFDSQQVRKKLAEKQGLATNLIGGEYLLEFNRQVKFCAGPQAEGVEPATPIRRLEVVITDAIAQADRVLLGLGTPTTYLILEPDSDLDFLDLTCLRESLVRDALAEPQHYTEVSHKLSEVILREIPVEVWSQDEILVSELTKRFRLQRDDRKEFGWYEHVLMMQNGMGRETYLTAKLRSDGACYLQSQYASPRGLYHTRIEVQTDLGPRVSERIPTMDDRSIRIRSGAWTIERILFTDPMDQELLRILVKHPNVSLTVKYIAGGSFFEEKILDSQYLGIIRDSYLMSRLVQYREHP